MTAPYDGPSRPDAIEARQARLARGWIITIAIVVIFALLLILALLLRSAWWIGEGPMTLAVPGDGGVASAIALEAHTPCQCDAGSSAVAAA